jgi:hypothetical protein
MRGRPLRAEFIDSDRLREALARSDGPAAEACAPSGGEQLFVTAVSIVKLMHDVATLGAMISDKLMTGMRCTPRGAPRPH